MGVEDHENPVIGRLVDVSGHEVSEGDAVAQKLNLLRNADLEERQIFAVLEADLADLENWRKASVPWSQGILCGS